MAQDKKNQETEERVVDRRDTLKLVSAVAALGLGLGVTSEAEAQTSAGKIKAEDVGRFSIKLFKVVNSSNSSELVETLDLSSITQNKDVKMLAGQYTIKLYNTKGESVSMLTENSIEISKRVKG